MNIKYYKVSKLNHLYLDDVLDDLREWNPEYNVTFYKTVARPGLDPVIQFIGDGKINFEKGEKSIYKYDRYDIMNPSYK